MSIVVFNASIMKSAIHCLKVSFYIYSIMIFNNNCTKIKVNKKLYAGLENAWLISPHVWGGMIYSIKGLIILFLRSRYQHIKQ